MTLARIERFEVERPLGSGSFATVWLARDPDLDAWVAVKLLADNWSMNGEAVRRFLDEARALRRLDSDRIVRCYEVGHLPDGRPFMVMEYADHGSLEDRMRLRAQLDQPFSVREAVEVSVQIAECLIAVHDLRIVHRDVKPSNVLFRSVPAERREALRREGKPAPAERTLLGDFGIARRLELGSAHTMVGGSPQYMAPEQADPATAGRVDGRSDVYAAAVILYELLAGRLPHGYATVTEVHRGALATAGPPSLARIRPDVPAALAEAVGRNLRSDPAGRAADAWTWRQALAPFLGDEEGERVGAAAALPRAGWAEGTLAPPRPDHSRTVRGSGRRSTAMLEAGSNGAGAPVRPIGQFPSAGGSVSTISVRVPGAFMVVASLLVLASIALPWVTTADGAIRRLGGGFRSGALAAIGAVGLFLLGVRLWRTSRRWVASVSAGVALLMGVAAVALSGYEVITLPSRVSRTIGGRPVGRGVGLTVLLAGGALAGVAGARALARLREDRLRARHPMLRRP